MKHSILKKITEVPMKRVAMVLLSLALVFSLALGGTLAYLSDKVDPIVNTFTPSKVETEVTEEFDGATKKNVNVSNASNIKAYIRVKLISYRVNSIGERIGGTAEIPDFTPGTGWVKSGDHYYYTLPIEPYSKPTAPLIGKDGIALEEYEMRFNMDTGEKLSGDFDGGKQVIEVMAEAIQALPSNAVQEAWGIEVNSDGSLKLS